MPQILFIDTDLLDIMLRLLAALMVEGMIGLERRYHGRPAGFRTHPLVCKGIPNFARRRLGDGTSMQNFDLYWLCFVEHSREWRC